MGLEGESAVDGRVPWVSDSQMLNRFIPLVIATLTVTVHAHAFSAEAILSERAEKDAWMRDSADSPFNYEKHKVEFSPLHYFPPSADWVFESKLTVYDKPEPITILDTKGRERHGELYGFLTFTKDGTDHTLRVYRMPMKNGVYYGIWFTDRTTGESTYDVGRYLDFEISDDPDHVYTIDFNEAYNPYCAYSPAYGCAIPRKEDHLDLAITAGEKKWHE